jgi:hypothetical protein
MMPTRAKTTLMSAATICTVDRSRQPAAAAVWSVAILPPGVERKVTATDPSFLFAHRFMR